RRRAPVLALALSRCIRCGSPRRRSAARRWRDDQSRNSAMMGTRISAGRKIGAPKLIAAASWYLPEYGLAQEHFQQDEAERRNQQVTGEFLVLREVGHADFRFFQFVDVIVNLLQACRVLGAKIQAARHVGDPAQGI